MLNKLQNFLLLFYFWRLLAWWTMVWHLGAAFYALLGLIKFLHETPDFKFAAVPIPAAVLVSLIIIGWLYSFFVAFQSCYLNSAATENQNPPENSSSQNDDISGDDCFNGA